MTRLLLFFLMHDHILAWWIRYVGVPSFINSLVAG